MVTPSTKTYSAAVNGLVTDGNDIANADQSTLQESNYELLRDGTRRRRRAILQEYSLASQPTVDKGLVHSCYLWRTPDQRTDISIVVEQRGKDVLFYQVEHDTPAYVRTTQLYTLDLEKWGITNYVIGTPEPITTPCTYTEGNGSLYIFNKVTGTVKVEMLDGVLRSTPIGTWIRDYENAEEQEAPDHRPAVLTDQRAYNLSNTGWDYKGVVDFFTQSSQGYTIQDPTKASIGVNHENIITVPPGAPVFPALLDRYLTGRQLDESGVESFSFKQLINARRNTARPPMGARIKSSDLHPAGSLVGEPYDRLGNIVQVASTFPSTLTFEIEYEEDQYLDITNINRAVFIHYMTFTINGVEGGFSGVIPATTVAGSNNKKLQFSLNGVNSTDVINITGLYVHPGPAEFPHRLLGTDSSYDYRDEEHPEVGAYFAGRLWQTGDRHGRIYYSQQVEAGTQSGDNRGVANESLCFSAADPTDGFDSALVATDGGYINLADSGTHYGLVTLGQSLILLTDRGIWRLSPGQAGFFLADDFILTKISDAEVLGYRAYTVVGDLLHVATNYGITIISNDGQSQSLTDERIKQEYDNLIDVEKRQPIAMYDPVTRVVRWMFPKSANDSTFATSNVVMLSYHEIHESWFRYETLPTATIVDGLVLPYVTDIETYNRFRYLTVASVGAVNRTDFSVEANLGLLGFDEWVNEHSRERRFTDFVFNPVAPDLDPEQAFMLTSHILMGDANKFSFINYVTAYNRNVNTSFLTETDGTQEFSIPGSTLLQARWDWFDDENKNKYSPFNQTYRHRRSYLNYQEDRSEPNLVSKVKVRGRGREFRLYWSSEDQADSHITGWTIEGLTHQRV